MMLQSPTFSTNRLLMPWSFTRHFTARKTRRSGGHASANAQRGTPDSCCSEQGHRAVIAIIASAFGIGSDYNIRSRTAPPPRAEDSFNF